MWMFVYVWIVNVREGEEEKCCVHIRVQCACVRSVKKKKIKKEPQRDGERTRLLRGKEN